MRFKIEEENQLLVPVSIGVSGPRRRSFEKRLDPVPANHRGIALIDTGATLSVLYRPVVEQLRIPARGLCKVYGFSSQKDENVEYPNFDISVSNLDAVQNEPQGGQGDSKYEFDTVQAVSPPCAHNHYSMLIGMDILSKMILHVNWPEGWFDLEKP